MRQRARVVKTEETTAWVVVEPPNESCRKCGGCMSLTGEKSGGQKVVEALNPLQVDVGELVILEMGSSQLLRVMGVLYGIPLLGLGVGYLITFSLTGADPIAGLGGLIGLVSSALVARPIAGRLVQKHQLPEVVARACV